LTTTQGASNQARQQILLCSGARTAQRTITAPAASKVYIVINATSGGYDVKLVGAGPTTGVTVANGKAAVLAWNGSDFVAVASNDFANLSGIVSVANGGTGLSTLTLNNVMLGNGTSAVQFVAPGSNGNVLTSNGTTWTSAVGVSLASNNAFTGANSFYNASGQNFGTATSTQDGVVIAGRAGGSSSYRVTLQPTSLTSSRTLTLPDNSGTVLTSGAVVTISQGGTNATATPTAGAVPYGTGTEYAFTAAGTSGQVLVSSGANAPTWGSSVIPSTAQVITSGTTIDFSSIPSWVKRVTLVVSGLQSTGSDNLWVRLGTSGGFVSTGYSSIAVTSGGTVTSTTTFIVARGLDSSSTNFGQVVFNNITGNQWVASGVVADVGGINATYSGGGITLGAALTQLRVLLSGANTFAAGTVNIFYE
jgi:hypothetical protein